MRGKKSPLVGGFFVFIGDITGSIRFTLLGFLWMLSWADDDDRVFLFPRRCTVSTWDRWIALIWPLVIVGSVGGDG